jgi:tRNA(Ile2) C34 agmatinyltransferase TiaS
VENAFSLIGAEREERVVPVCEQCGEEISGRGPGSRFCGEPSRKRNGYERRRDAESDLDQHGSRLTF